MITNINEFKKILENTDNVFDANFIVNYIISETENAISIHEDEDVMPDFFISIIKKDNCKYELKKLKIQDILNMDPDVNDYVMEAEDRYTDIEHPNYTEVENPIVIHKNQVFDGYNRLLTKYHAGDEFINAYINI